MKVKVEGKLDGSFYVFLLGDGQRIPISPAMTEEYAVQHATNIANVLQCEVMKVYFVQNEME
jgi:hypothetical protein